MSSAAEGSSYLSTPHRNWVENQFWETLGAILEMLQTAWSSLFRSLRLRRGDRLVIRERLDFGVDKAITDVMLEVEDLSRQNTTIESYSSAEKAVTVLSHFCSVL